VASRHGAPRQYTCRPTDRPTFIKRWYVCFRARFPRVSGHSAARRESVAFQARTSSSTSRTLGSSKFANESGNRGWRRCRDSRLAQVAFREPAYTGSTREPIMRPRRLRTRRGTATLGEPEQRFLEAADARNRETKRDRERETERGRGKGRERGEGVRGRRVAERRRRRCSAKNAPRRELARKTRGDDDYDDDEDVAPRRLDDDEDTSGHSAAETRHVAFFPWPLCVTLTKLTLVVVPSMSTSTVLASTISS